MPACLDVRLSPARNLTTRDRLAHVGHRVYLGLRRLRIARPSDCADTTADRQQKGPVCRSTSRARNIWNQLLHCSDGKRSGRYRFVAQAHERRSYLVAFIAAGEMRFVLECHGNASGAQKSKIVLIGLIAATIALELLLSANSQYDALWMISYKSTSVISFILAAASVAAAALHQPRHETSAADKTIVSLAAGTLAFYAVQSFTCNVWRPIFDNAIYTMATGIQTGEPRPAAAMLLGILMSLCLALALLLMDIVRRTVVEAIKARMNS